MKHWKITSDKASFIIYADLECLTEKIDGCKINPVNSSATKVGEHISSSFSMSTISQFKYRGKDCMKRILKRTRNGDNYFQKGRKMKILQTNSRNHMKMEKFVLFVKKSLKINMLKI